MWEGPLHFLTLARSAHASPADIRSGLRVAQRRSESAVQFSVAQIARLTWWALWGEWETASST